MKISERKQRLRARGIVPIGQEVTAAKRQTTSGAATKGRAAGGARPRRELSPSAQIAFGLAYIVFAPLFLVENFIVLRPAHGKVAYHPGLFELLMPALFVIFGGWQLSRGLRARRRAALAQEAQTVVLPAKAPKARLAKESSSQQ